MGCEKDQTFSDTSLTIGVAFKSAASERFPRIPGKGAAPRFSMKSEVKVRRSSSLPCWPLVEKTIDASGVSKASFRRPRGHQWPESFDILLAVGCSRPDQLAFQSLIGRFRLPAADTHERRDDQSLKSFSQQLLPFIRASEDRGTVGTASPFSAPLSPGSRATRRRDDDDISIKFSTKKRDYRTADEEVFLPSGDLIQSAFEQRADRSRPIRVAAQRSRLSAVRPCSPSK